MWFPVDPRLPPASHRSTAYSLWNGYAAFAASVIDSSWALGHDWLAQACRQFASDPRATWNDERRIRSFADDAINCVLDLMSVGPLAAERASRALARIEPPLTHRQHDGAPRGRQSVRDIGGKPLMLPARVGDASQAWALYLVSAAQARNHLQHRYATPGSAGSRAGRPVFDIVDVGGGSTLLGVFAVDYRDCDLGVYRELAVVLFVTPRDEPGAVPGILFLGLAVSAAFTRDAARPIWGFDKTLAEHLDVHYERHRAVFAADFGRYGGKDPCLSVAFPRFGRNRSRDVPFYFYSLPADAPPVAQKTLFSRSGSDEGIQFGGNVELILADPSAKCCLADGQVTDCLCKILRQFDLQPPVANTWSEHISGALHEPETC